MTIQVYSSPGCAACRMTERVLTKHGADFESISAINNADALKELGFAQAPVVVPDSGADNAWSGFRDERIKEAVAEQQELAADTNQGADGAAMERIDSAADWLHDGIDQRDPAAAATLGMYVYSPAEQISAVSSSRAEQAAPSRQISTETGADIGLD